MSATRRPGVGPDAAREVRCGVGAHPPVAPFSAPPSSGGGITVWSADMVTPITAPSVLGGAVAVRDGRILHVGARDWVLAALAEVGADFTEVHWPGVLLPGLVNAHTHLQYSAMAELGRGHYDGFHDWAEAFNAVYDAGPQDWGAASREGTRLSLAAGTTAAADVVTDAAASGALHDAGMHGVAYWEVMDWTNEDWRDHGPATVTAALDAMPTPPRVGLSPHAPYSLDARPLLDIPDLVRSRGLRLHIHLGESHLEAQWAQGRSGSLAELWRSEDSASFRAMREGGGGFSATEFVDQLGVLGPDCHVAHGIYMTAEDRRRLRARSTAVALCPRSNRVIGLDEPPVAAYLEEGNQVAVGTDSLSSSPSLDVLADLAELHELARSQGYSHRDLARRLLHAATLGGATALGLAVGRSRIGQLQVGAVADMVFLDVPVEDVVGAIHDSVCHGSGRQAATVVSGVVRWASPAFTQATGVGAPPGATPVP